MKLKLKLLLASMFFCSVIFAQGNAPSVQFRSDRAVNSEMQKRLFKSADSTLKQKVIEQPKVIINSPEQSTERKRLQKSLKKHSVNIAKKVEPSVTIIAPQQSTEQKRLYKSSSKVSALIQPTKKIKEINLKEVDINLIPSIRYTDKKTEKDLPLMSPAEKQAKQNLKKN